MIQRPWRGKQVAAMSAGGAWVKVLRPAVEGRDQVAEGELLEVVLLAGRRLNDDWPVAICRAMLALGWKRRKGGRYIRRPEVQVRATEGGAS